MSLCVTDCSGKSANTGVPSGANPFGVVVGMVVAPLYASDGTEFSIDCTSVVFDQTYLDGLINQSDKTKRIYPIMGLKNVESTKAENNVETFNDGSLQIISEGVRSFKGLLPGKTRQYLGQLKNLNCSRVGVYLIDACGNWLGSERVEGSLKPIRVAENTWSAILMWATDTTGQNIDLTFNMDKIEKDENHRMITAGEITADLSAMKGLIDVTLDVTGNNLVALSVDFDAQTIYGGCTNPILIEDLVAGDLTMTLNGSPETIVSLTETDGSYVLVYTTVAIATDVVTIQGFKDGLDFALLTYTLV